MPTPQYEPNVPMPYTTRKATKKSVKMGKRRMTRNTSSVSQIYAKDTYAEVADEATEARLNRTTYTAPDTSTRKAGYNILWGETVNSPQDIPEDHIHRNP